MLSSKPSKILKISWQTWLTITGLILLSSCTHVAIKDEAIYGDLGPDGAAMVHFLSAGETDISKEQWDSMREGMLCVSQETFGDFKAEIEELCSVSNACDYPAVEKDLIELSGRINVLFQRASQTQ